jgi:ribosomal 50S subunit-recycling heat shock protein
MRSRTSSLRSSRASSGSTPATCRGGDGTEVVVGVERGALERPRLLLHAVFIAARQRVVELCAGEVAEERSHHADLVAGAKPSQHVRAAETLRLLLSQQRDRVVRVERMEEPSNADGHARVLQEALTDRSQQRHVNREHDTRREIGPRADPCGLAGEWDMRVEREHNVFDDPLRVEQSASGVDVDGGVQAR